MNPIMSDESFGLPLRSIQEIRSIFRDHPKIERALIYGSRAKGGFHPGSDIDLVLEAPDLTTTDLLEIENRLEESSIPYKVDLSLRHQIEDPDLIDHIRRVGKTFYARCI